jgi:hypothetical protein
LEEACLQQFLIDCEGEAQTAVLPGVTANKGSNQ